MSGLITLGEGPEQNWVAANWAFWSLLRRVGEFLPADDILREQIEKVEASKFEYLSLEDATADDLDRFARAVGGLRDDLTSQGPSAFASPEFFPGYLENVDKLLVVLSEGARRRRRANAPDT
jgi:hypothetical protein